MQRLFSKVEQGRLVNAIEASLRPLESTDDFRKFIRKFIKPLIPHGMMIAVIGRVTFDMLRMEHVIGVDYPQEFIDQLKRETSLSEHRAVLHWLKTRKPLLIDSVVAERMLTEKAKREIEHFKLGNLAIHGHLDITGRMASYYSFAQVPPPLTERHTLMLEVLVPHIHFALMKVIPAASGVAALGLSKKEMEILRWVVSGKTNREIATILNKSELTVRNQLHKLFVRLGASNRAQAIRRADELGLPALPLMQ